MRSRPTILHLDMDAFYASVEQASKPSLRGKPVVVGGLGPRGVVATASYEARRSGVHSAMPMAQARRLCPHAAFLVPRFGVYRAISETVMALLGELSPLVEPLSLDEAFVDLAAGPDGGPVSAEEARDTGGRLRARIRAATGLTGSVGLAGSKMLAKIASERAKPDGLVLVPPGTERELLAPLPVRTLPGVGPATAEALRRAGIATVGDVVRAGEAELLRLLGKAHGAGVHTMALGVDTRPVVADRDTKSISVEDTFDVDVTDRARIRFEVDRLAVRCVERLRAAGRSGRTVVLKVRRYDFSTLTRSETLRGPTDDPAVVRESAARLLEGVDTTAGVRLLGVGVSSLAAFTQEDLFAQAGGTPGPGAPEPGEPPAGEAGPRGPDAPGPWLPGVDVTHATLGPGWVQGSGLGRVTVRFERPDSQRPGRVRTFRADDPELARGDPLPLVPASGSPPAAAPGPGPRPPPGSGELACPRGDLRPPGRGQRPRPGTVNGRGRPRPAASAPASAPAQDSSSARPARCPKSRSGSGGPGGTSRP
ncbi:DNA polymerase IV [Streptomyces sp. DSM 44917]|uniref:DNA polymerase IV n=1 Tax=Streptomyces boetiae TaxID=3075541 RepID=A0ABU2LEG6_9ACTN|nr:DNA polymerase IV [Streptomyces sp. DSM 44917]MDT0309896.1 DNA polymerase IV [Streptomyces sp. DSM 44917]